MTPPQRTPPAKGPDRQEQRGLAEVAALTGISRYTLAYAARTGTLKARRIGSQWVTTLAAVDVWLREARHRPGPKPQARSAGPEEEGEQGKALAA
jgi:Helix-turn-helix domain